MKSRVNITDIDISEKQMLALVREHYPYEGADENTQYSEYQMMCMGYDVLHLVVKKLNRRLRSKVKKK